MTTRLITIASCILSFISVNQIHAEAAKDFRGIPVPKQEHGYSNFESVVITSKKALETFLQKNVTDKKNGWNNKKDFMKAIEEAKIEFPRQALVLLRHTEGSVSTGIKFEQPKIVKGELICNIERKPAEIGAAAMAYYCQALTVSRTKIGQIEIKVNNISKSRLRVHMIKPFDRR